MRRFVSILSLAFCYLLAAGPRPLGAQPVLQAAPAAARGAVGPAAGFVPPAQDLSHVILAPPPAAKLRDLPARYDAREHGLVSPVKNQGACGSCYAFAAASDIESRVLADHGLLVDISENHLKECHFEGRSCEGGNAFMIANLLSLQGSVLESCDPYAAADVACNTGCPLRFAALEWRLLAGDVQPAPAALKQALLDHGPLSTTVYAGDAGDPAWSSTFNGWSGGTGLHHDGAELPNHAVVLVGWDDAQPHAGGGQGCWIVKNSWGEDWGDACGYGDAGGYFYLAYGSASFGLWTSVFTGLMPHYPELATLGWDEGGWTNSFGTGSTTSIWGMARFDPVADTHLHRVEFWTTDTTTRVDVDVYAAFTGGSPGGLLASVADLSFPSPGYQSAVLDAPLPLTAGDDYYVVLRLQNATSGWPLAVDGQGSRGAGRTWISVDGAAWYDLSTNYSCTAGIRVRTSPHDVLAADPGGSDPPPPPPALPAFALAAPHPNPFNPATSLEFTLDRDGPVNLRIFDLQGRLVTTLVAADLPAGSHRARWAGRDARGRDVPAGVYLCRLDDGLRSRSRRLVLVK